MEYVVLFVSAILLSQCEGQESNGSFFESDEYSYEDRFIWPALYPACSGKRQSPIDVESNGWNTFPTFYHRELKLNDYKKTISKVTLKNTGKTVKLLPKEKIVLTGGPANDELYQLAEVHFHFGNCSWDGSEHTVNGHRYAMEIHLVHWNSKYHNSTEAENHSDGLMVISVLAQEVYVPFIRHYGTFSFITENLHLIKSPSRVDVKGPFNLSRLLPTLKHFSYLTYHGSLTTPPCTEAVTWIISSNILFISLQELNTFRTLLDDNGKPIAGNTRPLQILNNRDVELVCYR